jgi:ppGpp synthetase/RelA/SpoT-type nucleotidyltranferase
MKKNKPPESITEYITWAKSELDVDFASKYNKKLYEQNVIYVENQANDHGFFKNLTYTLDESKKEYVKKRRADLFISSETPVVMLHRKSYESMVNKSYRYNVLWNSNFPKAPPCGWLTPDTWFSQINDTVRTTIVCKYIDGPSFLAEKLGRFAQKAKVASRYSTQQKDDGYYAYHFYIKLPVQMINSGKKVVTINVDVEIQLATQLQEVLYHITHTYYEDTRIQKIVDPSSWKWEYESSKFRAGYLSHTLHLLEAIILDIRNSSLKAPKKTD